MSAILPSQLDSFTPRTWQQECLEVYRSNPGQKNFTVMAWPGAGKTLMVFLLVLDAILSKRATKVLFLAPTETICAQIEQEFFKAFRIPLTHSTRSTLDWGLVGTTMCYASLKRFSSYCQKKKRRKDLLDWLEEERAIVVCDEAHHCWYKEYGNSTPQEYAARSAIFATERYRQSTAQTVWVTGTPYHNKAQGDIPRRLVGWRYEEAFPYAYLQPDFAYTEDRSVADGVTERVSVEFLKLDRQPDPSWLPDELVKYYLDPSVWEPLIAKGWEELRVRQQEHCHARGIIYVPIARVLDHVEETLGLKPGNYVTIESQHSASERQERLDRAKRERIPWIICCRTLGEGFNEPELEVCIAVIYSRFFRKSFYQQVVGRVGRVSSTSSKTLSPIAIFPEFYWIVNAHKELSQNPLMVESPYDICIHDLNYDDGEEREKPHREKSCEVKTGWEQRPVRVLYPEIEERGILIKGKRRVSILCSLDRLLNGYWDIQCQGKGVYYFYNRANKNELLYVGHAGALSNRITPSHKVVKKILDNPQYDPCQIEIGYYACDRGKGEDAEAMEVLDIFVLTPKLNSQRPLDREFGEIVGCYEPRVPRGTIEALERCYGLTAGKSKLTATIAFGRKQTVAQRGEWLFDRLSDWKKYDLKLTKLCKRWGWDKSDVETLIQRDRKMYEFWGHKLQSQSQIP